MTEHTATPEHAHHAHDEPHDPSGHDSPEHIKKEIRVYLMVLGGLAILTGITVWLCYGLDLPMRTAIVIAMIVASIKGFLVAAFFMHLLSERKLIYGVLILTVVFFGVLIWGPWHHHYDALGGHADELAPIQEKQQKKEAQGH